MTLPFLTAIAPRPFVVKSGNDSYLARRENVNPKVGGKWVWAFSLSQSAAHRFSTLLAAQRRLSCSDHRVVRLVPKGGRGGR